MHTVDSKASRLQLSAGRVNQSTNKYSDGNIEPPATLSNEDFWDGRPAPSAGSISNTPSHKPSSSEALDRNPESISKQRKLLWQCMNTKAKVEAKDVFMTKDTPLDISELQLVLSASVFNPWDPSFLDDIPFDYATCRLPKKEDSLMTISEAISDSISNLKPDELNVSQLSYLYSHTRCFFGQHMKSIDELILRSIDCKTEESPYKLFGFLQSVEQDHTVPRLKHISEYRGAFPKRPGFIRDTKNKWMSEFSDRMDFDRCADALKPHTAPYVMSIVADIGHQLYGPPLEISRESALRIKPWIRYYYENNATIRDMNRNHIEWFGLKDIEKGDNILDEIIQPKIDSNKRGRLAFFRGCFNLSLFFRN